MNTSKPSKKKTALNIFGPDILKHAESTAEIEETELERMRDREEEVKEKPKYEKNGYVRPEKTYTDQLSKEQIAEKLEDYEAVDDLYKVPLGVHIRYISMVDGKPLFRMGGMLHINKGLPEFIMLSNGPKQWSVQTKNTKFYRKMTIKEIKNEYQKQYDILFEKYNKLKDKYNKLKNE